MTFKLKWMEMAIGTLVAAGIIAGYPLIEREINRNKPIDEWFNVRQLEVAPITQLGDFPVIVFDRTVGQPFKANWIMELQSVEGDKFNTICKPTGKKEYHANEELDNQGESIKWFSEKFPECSVIQNKAGKYRIVVTWDIDRGKSFYNYKLEKISNVFEIVDPEAFIPSKIQDAINKTVREVEAKVEALEQAPSVAASTASDGVND
jgi:hypothetical protein